MFNSVRINRPAVERRVQTLLTRRTFKKASQAKAYLHAIACLDLTTLRGDDTDGRVDRLCAKALQPVQPEILKAVCQKYKLPEVDLKVGAVCVYPAMVAEAVKAVQGKIPVASVATGFPSGQTFLAVKDREIEMAIDMGAKEVDVVISRKYALEGNWQALYQEVNSFRLYCGDRAKMKVIIEISDLQDLEIIAKTSATVLRACKDGDFIKTSTGYGDHGATLEAGLVMARQIRDCYEKTGQRIGFKAAGGIKTAKDAMNWLILMKEELGDAWTYPELFRIGASSVLTDIEMQLEHLATGSYSAAHRQSIG